MGKDMRFIPDVNIAARDSFKYCMALKHGYYDHILKAEEYYLDLNLSGRKEYLEEKLRNPESEHVKEKIQRFNRRITEGIQTIECLKRGDTGFLEDLGQKMEENERRNLEWLKQAKLL